MADWPLEYDINALGILHIERVEDTVGWSARPPFVFRFQRL